MSRRRDWDYAAQKAETDWMMRELTRKRAADPDQPITLDIQFLPAEEGPCDPEGLVGALRRAGFEPHLYEQDGTPVVEATAAGARFSAADIWRHERRATEIALDHGFEPEGWGFIEARGF